MNDANIREHFHRENLQKYHNSPSTLVLDELGLKHGKCRADIAVINGKILGYEIKSNEDTFNRLGNQHSAYNSVFDNVTIIIGDKHTKHVESFVSQWWGITEARRLKNGRIGFRTLRHAKRNPSIDPYSVAQLLWKNEAIDILAGLGDSAPKLQRLSREALYQALVNQLSLRKLRNHVTYALKARKTWRTEPLQIQYGG